MVYLYIVFVYLRWAFFVFIDLFISLETDLYADLCSFPYLHVSLFKNLFIRMPSNCVHSNVRSGCRPGMFLSLIYWGLSSYGRIF